MQLFGKIPSFIFATSHAVPLSTLADHNNKQSLECLFNSPERLAMCPLEYKHCVITGPPDHPQLPENNNVCI
jgi:hypothetical protein